MATVKVEAWGRDDWYPVIDDDDGEPIMACPRCGGRVELYG